MEFTLQWRVITIKTKMWSRLNILVGDSTMKKPKAGNHVDEGQC